MKLSKMVLDFSLYPRAQIDSTTVARLVDALQAGEKLPPMIVDKDSCRIVDGFHRYRAYARVYGPEFDAPAEPRTYNSEGEIIAEAVNLNAAHGRVLSSYDRARAISLMETAEVKPDQMCTALKITYEKLTEIKRQKFAVGPDGESIPIKYTLTHLIGKQLSASQVEENRRAGGMTPRYYVNQLIGLLEANLIDTKNEALVAALEELHNLLERLFQKA